MKHRKLFLAISALALFTWTGCKKEYLSTGAVDPTIPVSYGTDIQPIFTSSCLGSGCHNTGGIPPILTADKSYNNLKNGGYIDSTVTNADNVLLYQYLTGSGGLSQMPPAGKLEAAKLNLIKTWILQGSKNN